MGVHHGDGGADSAGMMDERPRRRPVRWGGGGFTGGGGGGFGGAGSTATGDWPAPPRQARGRQATVPQRPLPMGPVGRSSRPSAPPETFREVTRNGYLYRIDESGRTRHVSGTLTLANAPRSRRAQAAAGGADRRPDDDGGHYIARRFNGPTDAFNYFAQNANFNRGRYRAVEDEWASQKKAGHSVIVRIAPAFSEGSHRPDIINIWWSVDGKPRSARIPNEKQEKHGGR